MKSKKQLKEAWKANERLSQGLLESMDEVMLNAKVKGRSRNVRRIWVHVHNVRINWVKSFGKAKCELPRLRPSLAHSPKELSEALNQSAKAVLGLLEELAAQDKVKILKKSPVTLLVMMVAHEAHHRGQILAILRHNNLLPNLEVMDSLWDWQE